MANMIARLDAVTRTTAPNLVLGRALVNKCKQTFDISDNDLVRIYEFFREDYDRFGFAPPRAERISFRGLGATMLANCDIRNPVGRC